MMAGRRPRANLIFSGHVSMSLFRRMARMPLLHDRHRCHPFAPPKTDAFDMLPRCTWQELESMLETFVHVSLWRCASQQVGPPQLMDLQWGRKPLGEVEAAELPRECHAKQRSCCALSTAAQSSPISAWKIETDTL